MKYNIIIYKKDNQKICTLAKLNKMKDNVFIMFYDIMIKYLQDTYGDISDANKLYNSFKTLEEISKESYNGVFFIKKSVTVYTIYNKYNSIINEICEIGMLDYNNITKTSFNCLKPQTISKLDFDSVMHLKNIKNVSSIKLFKNVQTIKFHESFNSMFDLDPTIAIKEVHLSDTFNQVLTDMNNVKIIHFGSSFNRTINPDFIKNVEELYFGYSFDCPLIFPNNLKKLGLGERFSLKLDFPDSLTWLSLKNYKYRLNKIDNLEYLYIKGSNYSQLENISFPKLVYLETLLQGKPPFNSYTSLKTLIIDECNNTMLGPTFFPPNLETLKFKNYKGVLDYPIPNIINLEFGSISQVIFKNNIIPNNLQYLKIGNQIINPYTLPNDVHTLELGEYYNFDISLGTLPKNLVILNLSDRFNCKIAPNTLNDIKELTLGKNYNQKFDKNVLPNTLESLTVGINYDKDIDLNNNSIKRLYLNYNKQINIKKLPDSLEELYFNNVTNIPHKCHISTKLPKNLHLLKVGVTIYGRKNIKNYFHLV